jgi:hypothetical protein
MSFIFSMALAGVAVALGVVVLTNPKVRPIRKAVALLGLLGPTTAMALMVVPFVLQE